MNKFLYLSAVLILYFVLSVIFSVFSRGLPVLTWEMITSTPGGGFYIGGKGGFLNAIMGSVYIVGGSTIIGLLISIPVADSLYI